MNLTNEPSLKGSLMNSHGFELVTERRLHEVGGTARLWKHGVTGAQLLSVSNADENKCFGVSFRTPPTDSTAWPTSWNIPCSAARTNIRSRNPSWSCSRARSRPSSTPSPSRTRPAIPVASANLQDFYNLIDVYIDAVFHPRISEDIFRQEGWHVEAEDTKGPWTYKGVVYNEMKGAYSSPDSVLAATEPAGHLPRTCSTAWTPAATRKSSRT